MRKLYLFFALLLSLLLPTSALGETELLENGDFYMLGEDGLPAGWYTEAWNSGAKDFSVEVVEIDGHNAVYICNPAANDARLCYRIPVEANSYYKISCYIKTSGVSGGAGANVSVVDSLATSAALTGTTADWEHVELVGKTGKGQDSIVVCVRLGGYGALSSGEAWFYGLSVTETARTSAAQDFSVALASSPQEDYTADKVPYFGAMLLSCGITAALAFFLQRKGVNNPRMLGDAKEGEGRGNFVLLLLAGLLLRMLCSLVFYGHSTDITCFMAWANTLAKNGLSTFYTSGMFADYPPGYMYVLWLLGKLGELLGLSYGSSGYALLVKIPGILADLCAAYVVWRMASKRMGSRMGLMLAAAVLLNPVMAFTSGGWGQIDQILALLLLASIWLFTEEKLELCGLVYGLAILVKPQALMVGPLLAVAYFAYLYDHRSAKALGRVVASVLIAVGLILLLSLPFKGTQSGLWILDKYLGTATSYPYASIEAFNLFALFGGNWASVEGSFLFLTYGTWGTIFICASVLFTCFLYVRSRKESYSLCLCAAFLLCALFMLGQYMHERYILPALPLLLVAFIQSRDKRLMQVFSALSVSSLLNVLAAFVIVSNQTARQTQYQVLTIIGSLLNLGGFAYLCYTTVDMLLKKRIKPAFAGKAAPEKSVEAEPLPPIEGAKETGGGRFTKRDRLYCWVLTAIYAVVALFNLGTTQAPENPWYGEVGDRVTITLPGETTLSEIWLFGGLYEGTATFTADDGTVIEYAQENGDMFRWLRLEANGAHTQTLELEVRTGHIWLNEIALFDAAGNQLTATASAGGETLLDEPEQVPETPSYLNGMYFDELYHARTAYEHLNGLSPYENSHPPLGKIIIAVGIAIFGMNAFGWRIMGTLFGIGMIPIFYAFARRLFKKPEYALLASALFAFDFMHFTQTRIATIDVFAVFFILLMYYYMYQYYCMDFLRDGLDKTLKPLALAGIFFGLGAASKWICIYAGGGLAVIFFTSLGQRFVAYRNLRKSKDEADQEIAKGFWRSTMLTLLWCLAFYIIVPLMIYLLSYMPYVLSEDAYGLSGIWGVQKFMFSYHSGLTATHTYQSAWWEWPLNLRPVWYYVSYRVKTGLASTISAFGNPAVWWVCSVGAIVLIVQLIRGKIRMDKGKFVLLVALCANYLPWVLVTRCTFAYHYFATVPTIILLSVYLVQDMEERNPKRRWIKWAWLASALILFAVYYPILSGLPCSTSYIHALEWLPGWTFLGY